VKVEAEIKKWGNSLALRISGVMAELPGFTEGGKVVVEVSEEGILVKPVVAKDAGKVLPYSEESLLAEINPINAHAQEIAVPDDNEWNV